MLMTRSGNLHAGATEMEDIYHCGRMIDSGMAFCYDRATNNIPLETWLANGRSLLTWD